jgi:hypothetical protein
VGGWPCGCVPEAGWWSGKAGSSRPEQQARCQYSILMWLPVWLSDHSLVEPLLRDLRVWTLCGGAAP